MVNTRIKFSNFKPHIVDHAPFKENSAIAVVDLVSETIVDIWPLGARSLDDKHADLSDKDGGIKMRSHANVSLWLQPDTIAFKTIGGAGYVFIANEGDSKEEKLRVAKVGGVNGSNFDPEAFPNAMAMMSDAWLGRMNMDPFSGLKNGYDSSKAWDKQGPYSHIFGYGGRSFSILRASDGTVVFDSSSAFEVIIANHPEASKCFNCDRDANKPDSRSSAAGVEPEAIAVFSLAECTYAAIGLERQSGLMVFDVTNPKNATFVDYIVNRNFTTTSEC